MKNLYKKLRFVIFVFLVIGAIGFSYYYYSMSHYTGIVEYKKSRDKVAIVELFNKNWYWLVSEYTKNFSPDYMLDHRAHDKGPEYYGQVSIKVMLQDGRPVGFISYYKKKFYEGFIWFLAVDQAVRNKKYGQQLLQYTLDDLAKQGVKYVRLITRTTNYPAQAIYKKFGFREFGRDDKFVDFEKVL